MQTSHEVVQEHRKLVRAWIWFWYHDITRLLLVMTGGHLVVTGPLLWVMGMPPELMREGLIGLYLAGFAWAMLDNDYTNLHRIGLSTSRKPLRKPADGL